MKVILVNGSPHQHGCTFTALDEARKTLEEEGIGTEMFWVGTKPLAGCLGCHKCAKLKHCVFDDRVNEFLAIAGGFDGFVSFHSKCKVWGQRTDTVQQFKEPGKRSVPRIF